MLRKVRLDTDSCHYIRPGEYQDAWFPLNTNACLNMGNRSLFWSNPR